MPVTQPTSRWPFHVIAKPIGAICNINCAYCFYLEKEHLYSYPNRAAFRMSPEVLESYVQQYIAAQPESLPEINFAWQGGEPTLLGVDFFRRAVALQKQYARPGQSVTNSFQTNGLLLDDEWCALFKSEGFLVGLSIDGPEALHDRYRVDLHGRGTFARVMAGLERLQKHGVEYNTLTVVQNDNGDHGAEVYRFLRGIGSRFLQIIPIVEYAGGKNAPSHLPTQVQVSERTVGPAQWGRFLNAVWDEWLKEDIGQVFVQHFDMMLGLALRYPATLCVHSQTCGRALAIEHNGDLYSCDHFVTPEYRLGNIQQRKLAVLVDSEAQQKFGADKSNTLPRYCRDCQYQRYCYGGCPAHRIKHTPSGEPGLNHLCEGYMLFYGHTLPTLRAMAEAMRRGGTARDYPRFLSATGN